MHIAAVHTEMNSDTLVREMGHKKYIQHIRTLYPITKIARCIKDYFEQFDCVNVAHVCDGIVAGLSLTTYLGLENVLEHNPTDR